MLLGLSREAATSIQALSMKGLPQDPQFLNDLINQRRARQTFEDILSSKGLTFFDMIDPETKKLLSRVLSHLLQGGDEKTNLGAMDDAYEEDADSSLPETEADIQLKELKLVSLQTLLEDEKTNELAISMKIYS